jgi:hypothetical protein
MEEKTSPCCSAQQTQVVPKKAVTRIRTTFFILISPFPIHQICVFHQLLIQEISTGIFYVLFVLVGIMSASSGVRVWQAGEAPTRHRPG